MHGNAASVIQTTAGGMNAITDHQVVISNEMHQMIANLDPQTECAENIQCFSNGQGQFHDKRGLCVDNICGDFKEGCALDHGGRIEDYSYSSPLWSERSLSHINRGLLNGPDTSLSSIDRILANVNFQTGLPIYHEVYSDLVSEEDGSKTHSECFTNSFKCKREENKAVNDQDWSSLSWTQASSESFDEIENEAVIEPDVPTTANSASVSTEMESARNVDSCQEWKSVSVCDGMACKEDDTLTKFINQDDIEAFVKHCVQESVHQYATYHDKSVSDCTNGDDQDDSVEEMIKAIVEGVMCEHADETPGQGCNRALMVESLSDSDVLSSATKTHLTSQQYNYLLSDMTGSDIHLEGKTECTDISLKEKDQPEQPFQFSKMSQPHEKTLSRQSCSAGNIESTSKTTTDTSSCSSLHLQSKDSLSSVDSSVTSISSQSSLTEVSDTSRISSSTAPDITALRAHLYSNTASSSGSSLGSHLSEVGSEDLDFLRSASTTSTDLSSLSCSHLSATLSSPSQLYGLLPLKSVSNISSVSATSSDSFVSAVESLTSDSTFSDDLRDMSQILMDIDSKSTSSHPIDSAIEAMQDFSQISTDDLLNLHDLSTDTLQNFNVECASDYTSVLWNTASECESGLSIPKDSTLCTECTPGLSSHFGESGSESGDMLPTSPAKTSTPVKFVPSHGDAWAT